MARAETGSGQMEARIVQNPLKLTMKKALEFCKNEPQLRSCYLIRIRQQHKYTQEGEEKTKTITYDVLNTNYE